MALTLDGHNSAVNNALQTITVTLTNTVLNAMIFVAVLGNNEAVSGVSDDSGQGLVWLPRATTGVASPIEVWYTMSPVPFSGVTITVTFNTPPFNFNGLVAWAVGGQNISSPFDGSPVIGVTDPQQISTTNPDCFIYTAGRFGATPDPTVGSGWLLVDTPSANNMIVEYKIVSSSQVNLQGTFTTGAGDCNGEIMDAIQAGSIVTVVGPVLHGHTIVPYWTGDL